MGTALEPLRRLSPIEPPSELDARILLKGGSLLASIPQRVPVGPVEASLHWVLAVGYTLFVASELARAVLG
jgi:hypothetical protein